ncbi:tectonin beta-propeller repeat-containing protein 2-like isoform X1 [Diadema antillarum]|uniref:tectonin beta-propeller repeat-containing protein 2-like isoform X1 n=1 Tax=Diadema antillarum TaxID=105358 RepID=UPI003A85AC82
MASRPLSILEAVKLREYAPLDALFKVLPKKAQRALTLSQSAIDVELTCLDASSEFIILGTNIAVVYLFDRQEQQLAKLKCEDKTCHVSCVKLLTCLDHQLAVGTSHGHIEIFLLPSRSHGHAVQAKKFVLDHFHQNNRVTCLEWSNNGMKLFSGDTEGKVIQTDIDFYENQCKASLVVMEEEGVVQLSYAHKKILISTVGRTIICTPEDDNKIQQVGQQPRKPNIWNAISKNSPDIIRGSYGAHFNPGLCKPSNATLYVARPGWRLWHANPEGVVLETIMFKDLIGKEHSPIQLLPDTPPAVIPPPTELQLGHLLPYSSGLLVSWSLSSLVVLQPSGPEGALVVASNFGELGSIVTVAVTRYEIFVLRKGCERNLVRIASTPELQLNKEPAKSDKDFGKIHVIRLNLVGNPSDMTLEPCAPTPAERMTSVKIKNKFSSMRGFLSKAADELTDKALETKNKMERNLERSFKLNLPIPERNSDDNVSVKSDRSSVNSDEPTKADPGTPEAELSEKLLVSVVNSSSMSGEVSPSGQVFPVDPLANSSNQTSGELSQQERAEPAGGKTEQSSSNVCPEMEAPCETSNMDKEMSEVVPSSSDRSRERNGSTGSNLLANGNESAADRVSIVITEDPADDQSAHVVQNLNKRQSAAFKISKDTLGNIDGNFESIVFQPKPRSKTKKKRKTVKGAKVATNVEIGEQNSSHVDAHNAEVSSSRQKTAPFLEAIKEGETLEEISSGQESPETESLTGVDGKVDKEVPLPGELEKSAVPGNGTAAEDAPLTSKTEICTTSSVSSKKECEMRELNSVSEKSLPRSLKCPYEEKARTSSTGCKPLGEESVQQPVESHTTLDSDSHKQPLSISMPKSLNAEDQPKRSNGELSPLRSPRSPRGLSSVEQTRRLGVVMEDFDLENVSADERAANFAEAQDLVHSDAPTEEKEEDTVDELPVIPERKKNRYLGKVKMLADASRPVSEFEDIYSKYRQTVMLMKESISEEDLTAQAGKDEVVQAANSDDSETESHESDEGDEVEPSLPESIQQKLAGSWMQCTTPTYIFQLLASERHIWYVDHRDRAHHSLSSDIACKWSKLKDAHSRLIAVSPSGNIVWRVHPKTLSAHASTAITQRCPVGFRWNEVSREVSQVCLDENIAWIIKQNGQLCVQKGLCRDKPYSKDLLVESSAHVVQIAANNGVVWARTMKNKVVYRVGITTKKYQGTHWAELPDNEHLKMVSIALDSKNTGWAITDTGTVWFRTGVSMERPIGDDQKWWQVCMSEYLMEDPNVLRMMVNMAGSATRVDRVVNWLKKQYYKATAIAANSMGVWVCSSYHFKTTLHVSKGNLLGSRWELSNPLGLPTSATWKCVCASPSYGPSGMIWALQTSGEIFCFSPETRKPVMVQSPDGILFDYISATTNAVWALSTQGQVYVRMDISERCPGGAKWKRLNLAQFGNKNMAHFTLGSDAVWAVDSMGGIHFRLGVVLPKYDALPLAWVPVDGRPVGYGVYFTHVFCSPTSNIVWAIDNKKTVYARQGVSKNLPVGLGWEPVEGTQANQLCISTDSVWALCPNGELACRFGISSENATGDYWKKIPGNFRYITVSQNDELWTIDNESRLFHRLTKMYIRSATTKAAAMETKLNQDDDDWELL